MLLYYTNLLALSNRRMDKNKPLILLYLSSVLPQNFLFGDGIDFLRYETYNKQE